MIEAQYGRLIKETHGYVLINQRFLSLHDYKFRSAWWQLSHTFLFQVL